MIPKTLNLFMKLRLKHELNLMNCVLNNVKQFK